MPELMTIAATGTLAAGGAGAAQVLYTFNESYKLSNVQLSINLLPGGFEPRRIELLRATFVQRVWSVGARGFLTGASAGDLYGLRCQWQAESLRGAFVEPGDQIQLVYVGGAGIEIYSVAIDAIPTVIPQADRLPPFPSDLAHVAAALGLDELPTFKGVEL